MAGYLSKRVIIVSIIAAVVVAGLVAAIIFLNVNNKGSVAETDTKGNTVGVTQTVCSEQLLVQARDALNYPPNIESLTTTTDEIKKLQGYRDDPNCLYVAIQYALLTSNSVDARNDLNSLKSVYKQHDGYSTSLGQNTADPAALDKMVSQLEKNNEAFLKPDTQIKDITDEPPLP